MKIVEKGNYKENWNIRLECTGKNGRQVSKPCHSKLEIEDGDIYFRDYRSYGGSSSERFYGFICPVCGCFTEIEREKIPTIVRDFAKDYNKREI